MEAIPEHPQLHVVKNRPKWHFRGKTILDNVVEDKAV